MTTPKKRPKQKLEDISDAELRHLVWEGERTQCMYNLWHLAKNVLGYKDLGELHLPICQVTQSINPLFMYLSGNSPWKTMAEVKQAVRLCLDKAEIPEQYKEFFKHDDGLFTRLFILFRGGFKSTLITIAHSIQLMLLYPDIRILICSHKKEDGSEPFLRAIKHHFMANQTFRALFPEWCPKANKMGEIEWGTKDSVTLPNRSPNCAHPESTIETAGMTTNVTGRHYDIIKGDDLVTKDSVTNEAMLQQTRQQYALLNFLFDQPEWGVKDVIGTPYHFADLYADLRHSKKIIKIEVPVILKDDTPAFPERFTREGIEEIKVAGGMTSYEFSCQYMLNPVPTEDQTFRPEWFERLGFFYETPPENLKKAMFVDPANKRMRQSDYTAMMVLGKDEKGMLYLLDLLRDKLNVEERTNVAFEKARAHGLKHINWEAVGFQDTDRYIMEQKSKEFGYPIHVNPIKASKVSKEDRIRGLQPLYERGMIRWPRNITYYSKYERKTFNMIELLRDEMVMFPKSRHDDMIDCHAQLLQVTMGKPAAEKATQAEDAFMWWRKQAIQSRTKPKFGGFTHAKKREHIIPSKESWR